MRDPPLPGGRGKPMTTELLECIERETGAHPDAAVIWLHGLGADGNDFVPIVNEMRLPASLSVRFVFPHAPVRPVTLNNGFRMRAWYDIAAGDITNRADVAGVRASQAQIEALIAREEKRGVKAARIVLAGFSQGGVVALHTGLRHAERLAGIVALSTYVVLPDQLAAEASAANRDIPIFMAHGTMDPMIRVEWGEASRRALESAGYRVEWHTYPMPHSVVWEEVEAVTAFLGKVLGRPQR
jgi:phospholipase/carboxylesterase